MLEVCVDRLEAVRQAIDAGAQRIELSENLSVGGVTPSMDLIKATRAEIPEALLVFWYDVEKGISVTLPRNLIGCSNRLEKRSDSGPTVWPSAHALRTDRSIGIF